MTRVDVIVLDLDGGPMLDACLESIAGQTLEPSRVIVWDNGSSKPVAERIRGDFPFELVIERSATNLGFTGGINRAMAFVTAPFVAWVNNDAVLDPEWIEALRRELDHDDGLGAVQSWIRGDDRILDGAGIDISSGTFVQAGHGVPVEDYRARRAAWGVSATAAIYRVSALRDPLLGTGVLHPRFFAWYEDVELSARLHARGWRTTVVPRVLALHRGSSSSAAVGRRASFLRTRNRYWTARLHPGVGRIRSLLAEDLRLLIRRALSLQIAGLFYGLAGIWMGLAGRVRRTSIR